MSKEHFLVVVKYINVTNNRREHREILRIGNWIYFGMKLTYVIAAVAICTLVKFNYAIGEYKHDNTIQRTKISIDG